MKKRLLPILLAVLMLFSLLPTMAFAGEADCSSVQKVTAIEAGESYQLKLGGKDVGYYKFIAANGGWKIMQSSAPGSLGMTEKPYLTVTNGKLGHTNDTNEATVWTYKSGAFCTTQKTTQRFGGIWWGWMWIPGWGSKTVTTTYYLSSVTDGAKLSTRYVGAELFKTLSGEHDFGCWIDCKDGANHKHQCKHCGEWETEAHSYDDNTHKCVCGAYDPAESSVKISVDVKEKTSKQYVGWWFWGTWKDVTTYTATIKTVAKGVKVTKVQYQLNGGRWTNGTCAASDKPIESLKVKAWDSNGKLYEYEWPEEPAPVYYNVTAQVQGDHGTATLKIGEGEATSASKATKDTSVVFTATPENGYAFDYWEVVSGGIDIEASKANNPITVTMPDTALTLKAHFKAVVPSEYNIIVEDDGHGTAKAQVNGIDVTSAAPGTIVTLVAAPDDGYQLKDWQDQRGSMRVSRTNTFKMPESEVKMKAIFQRVYTIEVVAQGHGTASASDPKSIAGREITLTATPEDGYKLDHWVVERGGVTVGDNDKFFVGTEDVKIKAIFVADTPSAYNIIVEDDGHGTASADPTSAAPGATVNLTATPNDGYAFKEWDIARGLDAITGNSFTMPSNEVKVKAIFERVYNITLQTNEHGKASATVGGETATTAAANAEVTLTATPDEGYKFKEWKVVSGGMAITENKFTMPASNVTVQAVFEEAAPEIKTLADLMNLQENFPASYDESNWINEISAAYKIFYKEGSLNVSTSIDGSTVSMAVSDNTLTKNTTGYEYAAEGSHKVIFVMDETKISSIEIQDYSQTEYNGSYAEPACIAAGTMISMPGGRQKAVEELEIGDVICTFDHEKGEVSSAPVCFIWESKNAGNAFTLTFEDDIEVTVIEEHGFYDQEEQKYVFINLQNAEEYIGDHFYDADTDSWLALKSCEALNYSVDAYAVITSGHLNHMSNGMLSMCDGSVKVLANIFEYDDQIKFDEEKKKADIEAYGLTSKEKILELEGFTEADYDDYNLQYVDVMIGKGLITWEDMEALSDYCVANGL